MRSRKARSSLTTVTGTPCPGGQQLAFCAGAIAVILLVTSAFPSWRRDFWRPIGGAIPKLVRWIGRWRLTQKPLEDTRRPTMPAARIVGPSTRSGDVIVGRNMDGTKSVSWANGFQIGVLRPASGNRWEVIYGHRGFREFDQKAILGYAATERDAIAMLKEKDNEEASESQQG